MNTLEYSVEDIPDQVVGQLLWTVEKIEKELKALMSLDEWVWENMIAEYIQSEPNTWMQSLLKFSRAQDHYARLVYDAIELALRYVDDEDLEKMFGVLPWYMNQKEIEKVAQYLPIDFFDDTRGWIYPNGNRIAVFLKIALWKKIWRKSS